MLQALTSWITCLCLCLTPACAIAEEVWTVAVDNNSPPFAFENQQQAQGIYVDLLQAVARQAGLRLDIRAMPWRRAMQGLALGQHGVAGLYKNEERAQRYLLSEPIWQEALHVFTLPASSLSVNGLADLQHRKLGTLAGWYYSDALQQMLRRGELVLEPSESDSQNIGKLQARRLDAILALKDSIHYLQRNHPRLRQRLRDAGMLFSHATHIALPFTPGNIVLMDRINTALRQIDQRRLRPALAAAYLS